MRLTKDYLIDCGCTVADVGKEKYHKLYTEKLMLAIKKLNDLEDIEDICEKIINQTFYYKLKNGEIIENDNIKYKVYYDFKNKELLCYHDKYISHLLLDEYGKTWAFTKKELKKNEI